MSGWSENWRANGIVCGADRQSVHPTAFARSLGKFDPPRKIPNAGAKASTGAGDHG